MNCPVCNSPEVRLRFRIPYAGNSFTVYRCGHCDTLFRYPLPANSKELYGEGYYSGTAAYSYQDERKNHRANAIVHRSRLKSIQRFAAPGVFLDIGCAFGGFVAQAHAAGFHAYGIDVSDYAVNEGRRFLESIRIPALLFRGDLKRLPREIRALSGTFSVITLIEVLEHLPDPAKTIETIHRLLKPGGLLLIQTANFRSWQYLRAGASYNYFMPGHLVYHNERALSALLARSGFEVRKSFRPVDFSLFAKIRKFLLSGSIVHQLQRLPSVIAYHLRSRRSMRGIPETASWVLYATKKG